MSYCVQNEEIEEKLTTVENERPTNLPNLITNHNNINNLSPESTTFNSNWNNDSWADGEFEPIDEVALTGKTIY